MPPPTTLLNLLEYHGEKHLLAHWDQLSEGERSRLKAQLMAIDWPQIAACKKLIAARQEKRSVTKHQNFENFCKIWHSSYHHIDYMRKMIRTYLKIIAKLD